jgi:hypothetical protein
LEVLCLAVVLVQRRRYEVEIFPLEETTRSQKLHAMRDGPSWIIIHNYRLQESDVDDIKLALKLLRRRLSRINGLQLHAFGQVLGGMSKPYSW